MVNGHSAGEFSLNSMIDCANTALRLNGICALGTSVHQVLQREDKNLCLFKDDIRGTYRLMPMHPYGKFVRLPE